MPLRIGLAYNPKKAGSYTDLPEDFYAEFDDEETVEAIAKALMESGNEVLKIEADEEAYSKIRRVRPDIVFNIAEGVRGESRESQIPAILELLGIPYTGSGPLTLAIALNKALTHGVLEYHGIDSPRHQLFRSGKERSNNRLRFPLIVKPVHEGSSKGVRDDSLVRGEAELRERVIQVIERYDQPAIVEEYLPGREFTVGLLGNHKPVILPIVEITFDHLPTGANKIYSYEAKWMWDNLERPLEIFTCPADISRELEQDIKRVALETFQILECRDMCRIDIRLDENNIPHILEVNPLPGMMPDPRAHSCLIEAARAIGLTYNELINTILFSALERYGMQGFMKANPIQRLIEKREDTQHTSSLIGLSDWLDYIQINVLREEYRGDIVHILQRLEEAGVFSGEEVHVANEIIDLCLGDRSEKEYAIRVAVAGDKKVLGYICYGKTPLTEGTYSIYWVAVDPSYQGNGIGGLLLRTMEKELINLGARMILVETSSWIKYKKAQGFYTSSGYREVARIENYYNVGNGMIIYMKVLSPLQSEGDYLLDEPVIRDAPCPQRSVKPRF